MHGHGRGRGHERKSAGVSVGLCVSRCINQKNERACAWAFVSMYIYISSDVARFHNFFQNLFLLFAAVCKFYDYLLQICAKSVFKV